MSNKQRNASKPAIAREFTGGEDNHLVSWKPTRGELRVLGLHYLERYWSTRHAYAAEGNCGADLSSFLRLQSIAEALGHSRLQPEWDAYNAKQRSILSEIEERAKKSKMKSRKRDEGEAR